MVRSMVLESWLESGASVSDSAADSGGFGVTFFMMELLALVGSCQSPAVKQDWVAAVRGLTDRKRKHPVHPKMPHAQPPERNCTRESMPFYTEE